MNVLGIDLSLRATGLALVPGTWGLDWSRVITAHMGAPLSKSASEVERAARLRYIRGCVIDFAKSHGADLAVLEQYAFSAQLSHAHALGELGGVVKVALAEAGLPIVVVPPASARKLLGKQPRSGAKEWAAVQLYAMGAPRHWSADECDAFIVANYILSERGGTALIVQAA